MYRLHTLALAFVTVFSSYSQNDVDAIRYARSGVGGSSRFIAMGGAFGAIGADPSCAAYNPAGLGLIRKGEISFSGSLRLSDNVGSIYKTNTSLADAKFAFNNFAFAYAWSSNNDPDSRNVIAFTNSQLLNFSSSIRMSGYTNSSSIAKDMLTLANEQNNISYLNYNYEGLAYNSYLLDSVNGHFISLLDPKRTVRQTRDLATSGSVNELNFSYAYSYKDKFYLGASLGIPRVEYTSTTTHTESDDKDSMRIAFAPDTSYYTSTFVDGLPDLTTEYVNKLAFNSLEYTEYFKTQGSGINLKIGGVVRLNDMVRLGFYYHTPTVYNLSDTYSNSLSVTFDANKSTGHDSQNPVDGNGYFNYKIVTPSRFGLNSAFIINKIAVIGLDYELVNYQRTRLSSNNISDFAGVNAVIKNDYSRGHNVKAGAELNIKPVMVRAGYAMQGSPYGDVFAGNFVRHTVSAGIGLRGKGKWYLDLALTRSFSKEVYYPFITFDTKATLSYNVTTLAATVGIKF